MLARSPALAAALLVSCVLARAEAADVPGVEEKTSSKGGKYLIRVPKTFDKDKSAVMVVGFYGGVGQDAKGEIQSMSYQASLADAILVAPKPLKAGGWQVSAATDVGAAGDLIAELTKEYRPTRTIVEGYADGGSMAYGVALTFPDLVNAAVPQLGSCYMAAQDAPRRPIFFVSVPDKYDKKEEVLMTVRKLQNANLTVQVEHTQGTGNSDIDAVKRGFDWVAKTLGPAVRPLADAEANERIAALDKALKDKDVDASEKGFQALWGAPKKVASKLAGIIAAQIDGPEEKIALAAIELAGFLGEDGVKALKKIQTSQEARAKAAATALARTHSPKAADALLALLKADQEEVAVQAASELENLGGDAAINALVAGLEKAEASSSEKKKSAINDTLKKLTSQSFATVKEWKKWLKERPKG